MGFIINIKKLGLKPAPKIAFLGLIIDAVKMIFIQTEEKFTKITGQCQDLLSNVDVRIEKKWHYFFIIIWKCFLSNINLIWI